MNIKLLPLLRKALVIAVGFPLLALGLIMIPLPGPGLPVCVAGLFVLSLEFEWARKHLRYARKKLNGVLDTVGFSNSKFGNAARVRIRSWCASDRSGR